MKPTPITLIILFLVPSAYVAVEDVKRMATYLFGGVERDESDTGGPVQGA